MDTGTPTDVLATIDRFVREELLVRRPGTALTADTNLIEAGIVDSVGVFRVVGYLEDTFGFAVPPEALRPQNFGSIRAIADYVGHRSHADRRAHGG